MSEQLESILKEVMQATDEDDKQIEIIDDETIQIKTQSYRIVEDYREGFQVDAFIEKYQDFFEKYDFIFGDWGHEQLRLRGFYQLGRRKVPFDQQINFLDDYIKEYCNFGCAYFLIGKIEAIDQYEKIESKNNLQNQKSIQSHDKPKNKSYPKQSDKRNEKKATTPSAKNNRKFNKRKAKPTQVQPTRKQQVTEKRQTSNFVIKKIKKD